VPDSPGAGHTESAAIGETRSVTYTLVSFHAHPDDEALLTAGTLAKAAAAGHRVVLVTATAGERGLTSQDVREAGPLHERRLGELRAAARLLGCARVECLGYPDSGLDPRTPGVAPQDAHEDRDGRGPGFAVRDVEEPARRLAALLREEGAHVLTTYDPTGGYGHPDHIQVHRVGARAAVLAGTPVVLEATVDRRQLVRAARLVHRFPRVPDDFSPARLAQAYTPSEQLTHRIDVGAVIWDKRAAMAAHVSQGAADTGLRTLQVFLKLPGPLYRRAFRYEWFTDRSRLTSAGRRPGRELLDDVFAGIEPDLR